MTTPRTYRLAELAAASGLSRRTIRTYIYEGLLPAVEFRGSSTVYTEEHHVRLLAIRTLRAQRHGLEAIREALLAAAPAQLAQWAGLNEPPAANPEPPTVAASSGPQAEPPMPVAPAQDVLAQAEPWSRVTLLPGLELHIRTDATPLVLRLAQEIQARYAATPGSATSTAG